MTEFNAGDRIRTSATSPEGMKVSKLLYLTKHPDNGELYTFHPFDSSCPVIDFNKLLDDQAHLADDDPFKITFELDRPVTDVVPTEPGDYEDVTRYFAHKAGLADPADAELSEKPWTLNEDGSWTAPDGERQGPEDNWLFGALAFNFVPWAERDTIPARFDPFEYGL